VRRGKTPHGSRSYNPEQGAEFWDNASIGHRRSSVADESDYDTRFYQSQSMTRSGAALVASVLAIGLVCYFVFARPTRQEIAVRTVELIEEFRATHKRLPENLGEIGVQEKEEGPVYYMKQTEHDYLVWYGKQLGISMTYDSRTRTWRETD
jgi:hypothetical protein